jgi:hypothetical protein
VLAVIDSGAPQVPPAGRIRVHASPRPVRTGERLAVDEVRRRMERGIDHLLATPKGSAPTSAAAGAAPTMITPTTTSIRGSLICDGHRRRLQAH